MIVEIAFLIISLIGFAVFCCYFGIFAAVHYAKKEEKEDIEQNEPKNDTR